MSTMDVNEEYESIFGVTQCPTLYVPNDVEYLSFRQEIIDVLREFNIRTHCYSKK